MEDKFSEELNRKFELKEKKNRTELLTPSNHSINPKKLQTLILLCSLNSLKEALFLLLAPFFPEQMKQKQVPELYYAPLFASYSVFLFVASLAAGSFQTKIGRALTLRIGIALHAIACVFFIMLKWSSSVGTFLMIGFAGRIIEGIGAGLLQTAAYGEVIAQNKEDQSRVVGLLEFAAVFGNMGGLLFASFLAHIFGFIGPFAALGLIFFTYAIFLEKIIFFLPQSQDSSLFKKKKESNEVLSKDEFQIELTDRQYQRHRNGSSDNESGQVLLLHSIHRSQIEGPQQVTRSSPNHKLEDIQYSSVLKNVRGAFGFASLVLSLALFTFIDTTLADKLQAEYSLSSELVSIIYAIQMAAFLVTCLLVHKAVTKWNPTVVITLCFVVQAIGTLLLGPSHIFSKFLPENLTMIVSGLILIGLAGSFTSIGAYTEMYEPYIQSNPSCDQDQLSDILSGLYNAGFSLGTIIGPMAGSYITIWYQSFGVCTDYFAFTTLIYCLIIFVIVILIKSK